MAPRKKKQLTSYSWALKFSNSPEERYLSEDGRLGLGYAQALAEIAQERSVAALQQGADVPDKLTVATLAAEEGTSPARIHRLIRHAIIEIFGKDLSQSAIYYRLDQLQARRGRTCAQPDCDEPLEPQEPISRLYCHHHSQGRNRTARCREQKRAAANPQKARIDAHT